MLKQQASGRHSDDHEEASSPTPLHPTAANPLPSMIDHPQDNFLQNCPPQNYMEQRCYGKTAQTIFILILSFYGTALLEQNGSNYLYLSHDQVVHHTCHHKVLSPSSEHFLQCLSSDHRSHKQHFDESKPMLHLKG